MADETNASAATSTDTGSQSTVTTNANPAPAGATGGEAGTQGQQTSGDGSATAKPADAATETKTDPAKAGEASKETKAADDVTKAADAANTGAPEAYAAPALPEGITFSNESLGKLTTVSKELNLSQDAFQKLATAAADFQKANAAALRTQIQEVNDQWAQQSKTDKEFGGENYEVNTAIATQAAKTFGSSAFMALLKESGMEKHPEFIRTFLAIGKAISPDILIGNGDSNAAGGDAPVSPLSAMAGKLYGGKK